MKALKITVSLMLLVIAALIAPYIEYDTINNLGVSGTLYFLLVPSIIVFSAHVAWDLRRFYIPVVPFVVFSVAFYWLSFYLLAEFSTYVIAVETYIASIYCYVAFILVYFISGGLVSTRVYDIDLLKEEMIASSEEKIKDLELFWKIGVIMAFSFTTLFFIKAGNIPMLAANPELARVEAMKGAGTIQRLSYLPMYFAVFSLTILLWLKHERISRNQLLILVAFIFYNMLTGPRSYALWVAIYFFISVSLLNYGKIRLRGALLLLTAVFMVVAVVGGVRYSGLDSFNIEDTIIRFVNRIYMNPVNADRIVDAFQYESIVKNSMLIELEVLLPGYQPDLGTYLKEYVGAEFDGGGITVPLPAEGYMNFGMAGAIFYGILFAVALKIFEVALVFVRNPMYRYTILVMFSMQFMGVVTMGMSGIFVKTTIPAIVAFLLMLGVMKVIKRA